MSAMDKWNVLFIVLIGLPIAMAVLGEGGVALGMLIFSASTLLYVTPMYVATRRHRIGNGPLIVVNLFLGWTFIGWVVALAMASGGETA